MGKKKYISITEKKSEFGTTTQFKTNGMSDFEVLGMLTYYKETFLIKMFKEATKQTGKTEEEIIEEYEKSIEPTKGIGEYPIPTNSGEDYILPTD